MHSRTLLYFFQVIVKGRLYSEFPAMIKYAGIDIYKGFFDAAQNDG